MLAYPIGKDRKQLFDFGVTPLEKFFQTPGVIQIKLHTEGIDRSPFYCVSVKKVLDAETGEGNFASEKIHFIAPRQRVSMYREPDSGSWLLCLKVKKVGTEELYCLVTCGFNRIGFLTTIQNSPFGKH